MAYPKPEKTLFQTDLTETADTDIEGVGTIRKDAFGNVYRWVQSDDATASTIPAYGPAAFDVAAGTSVIEPTTATMKRLGGIAQAALSGGKYGWILCQGLGSALLERTRAATNATWAALAVNDCFVAGNTVEALQYTSTPALANVAFAAVAQTYASLASNDTSLGQASNATIGTGTYSVIACCRL